MTSHGATWTVPNYLDEQYSYHTSYQPDFTTTSTWPAETRSREMPTTQQPSSWPRQDALYDPISTWSCANIPSSRAPLSRHSPEYLHSSPGSTAHYPETDEPGRWYCTFPDCESHPDDRTFTRKSDWKRHTDKHTRPYRCPYPGCEDLPGFGWIGGLNRHTEELHKAAAQHKCPYPDCKRHTRGFNRSANLKNHIRKVHNVDTGSPSEAGGSETDMDAPRGAGRRRGLMEEIKRAERDVEVREREEVEAGQRKMYAVQRLQDLRMELEESAYLSSGF